MRTDSARHTEQDRARADSLSREIIGAAIEVHRALGPGLLESAYQECLCRELSLRGVPFLRQVALPIEYKGTTLDAGYRLDLVVDDLVLLELKSVAQFDPIHEAQLLTYLRLAEKQLGLLVNFNVPRLRDGIKRIVNG